jgi:cytochrome c oxidase subunit 1
MSEVKRKHPDLVNKAQEDHPDAITPETYLSVVTMHGTIMVFFVVSLALVSGFGNFLIPLMVGARDMAYPFLNMLSYWVIVPACLLMLLSFLVEGGAAAAGWTAYPPLSALREAVPGSQWGQTLWLLAMALFIVSFTMGGLNYLTTILNLRTQGMSMMRLPLVIWTFLISTILGMLAFPPLTAAAIMLLLDRHGGTNFYLSEGMILGDKVLAHAGGTPLLFQHLFWFLGHPEVYVLVMPAIGVAFEVLATFSRRPPFGYRVSVYSMLVIAVLSMIVWGHHMFVSGMNPYVGEYFSVATVLITLPFSVLGLNLIAGLWREEIRLETPMMFALGLVSAIGTGGLGGLYLGTASSDIYFHESYFVVGHFYFMIGMVTFLGIFAGVYYWFPKMFGRMMNDNLGKLHFWLTIVSMFTMFLLMHYQGLGGSLRRTYDPSTYDLTEFTRTLNLPISMLGFTAVGAQSIFLFNFFWSLFRGKKADQNPWQSAGLEWSVPSPAPHGNWPDRLPTVNSWPYDYGPDNVKGDFTPQAST